MSTPKNELTIICPHCKVEHTIEEYRRSKFCKICGARLNIVYRRFSNKRRAARRKLNAESISIDVLHCIGDKKCDFSFIELSSPDFVSKFREIVESEGWNEVLKQVKDPWLIGEIGHCIFEWLCRNRLFPRERVYRLSVTRHYFVPDYPRNCLMRVIWLINEFGDSTLDYVITSRNDPKSIQGLIEVKTTIFPNSRVTLTRNQIDAIKRCMHSRIPFFLITFILEPKLKALMVLHSDRCILDRKSSSLSAHMEDKESAEKISKFLALELAFKIRRRISNNQ